LQSTQHNPKKKKRLNSNNQAVSLFNNYLKSKR